MSIPSRLTCFFDFRYTPSPLTIFQGIRKLAPGTMLVVEKRQMPRRTLVQVHSRLLFRLRRRDEEAARELLDLYRGAVKRHLLSDVPVGILLSGGLDSGLLLALMNEQGGPWPAYTVGYGESFRRRRANRCRRDRLSFRRAACDGEARPGRV